MSAPATPVSGRVDRTRGPAVDWWKDTGPEAEGLAPASADGALALVFELAPQRSLRRVPGRETFPWPGHAEWIVKRSVGGEPRDFWHDLLRGRRRSPARREAENLAELARRGVAVPKPLLWVEEGAARRHPRRAGRSALVLATVPHEESLRQRLARAPYAERRALLAALLELVARLHGAGWVHRDLYLEHVVLAREGARERLVLLDAGRARPARPVARRWRVKDLAALQHSAPASVTRAERWRFLVAWCARVEGAGEPRALARRVLRKARRIARHVPRHVDPGSVEGLGARA